MIDFKEIIETENEEMDQEMIETDQQEIDSQEIEIEKEIEIIIKAFREEILELGKFKRNK